MNRKRALVKTSAAIAAAAVLGTAIIGVAHTPWGRPLLKLPLLSALAQHAGCPVGPIEPAAFEQIRATKLAGDVGSLDAAGHPALGFVLGRTRRSDVAEWVEAAHADCKTGFVTSVLECENVVTTGAPLISHVRLQFDAAERLVAVDLFRSAGTADALVKRFVTLADELDHGVGPATSSLGTPSVAFMQSTPWQTAVRTYRYRDYVATALLLNLGKRGLKLREQYQWLPPKPPA